MRFGQASLCVMPCLAINIAPKGLYKAVQWEAPSADLARLLFIAQMHPY